MRGYREQIESLLENITEESSDITSDLETLKTSVSLIIDAHSLGEDTAFGLRDLLDTPRLTILSKIFSTFETRTEPSDDAILFLNQLRDIEKPVCSVRADLEILSYERMQQWPDHSDLEFNEGFSALAHKVVDEYQFSDEAVPIDNRAFDDLDAYLHNQLIGSTLLAILLDCEAVARLCEIETLRDQDLLSYIAATSAAERYCVDRLGKDVWDEAEESVVVAVGEKRLNIIRHFIIDLASRFGQAIQDGYDELEPCFYQHLGEIDLAIENPNQLYRAAVQAADVAWPALR